MIPLGFHFDFFSASYNQLYVCANGFLTFLPGQPCDYQSAAAPTAATPNALIAGWWEDLNPEAGGSIHYAALGTAPVRRFVVQFTNVPHYRRNGNTIRNPFTFQIVLSEATGGIEVRYQGAPEDDSEHLAGIEDATGTSGLTYYYGDQTSLVAKSVR